MKNLKGYLKEKGFLYLLDQPIMKAEHSGSDMSLEQLFEGYTNQRLKALQSYHDTTVGLWCTDRPEWIKDEKKIMFQLTKIENL